MNLSLPGMSRDLSLLEMPAAPGGHSIHARNRVTDLYRFIPKQCGLSYKVFQHSRHTLILGHLGWLVRLVRLIA